jgi:hypothetical protein
MKKRMAIILVLSALFTCLFACGDGEKEGAKRSALPGKGGPDVLTWTHIPIYPGATQIDANVMMGHPQYRRFETRLFNSPDAPEGIDSFYRDQMPLKGWKSYGQADLERGFESTWGTEDKNTMCWVRIKKARLDGSTEIEIIRAQGKN